MNAINKLIPFRSGELTDADKKRLFEDATDYQKDRAMMGRAALKAAWWVGGTGAGIGVLGMVCAATLFPLKTREVEYYAVNQVTGYVGPSVGAKDAPTIYTEQTQTGVMQKYIELREQYQFTTDPIAFHRVTLMSSTDEQVRYKVLHDAPASPARALRDRGYIITSDNMQFFRIGDGRASTKQWAVKFDRKVVMSGQPVPDKWEPCTAEISFQFHPEYPMNTPDRHLNPEGLWVVSYASHSDNPAVRTN